MSRTWSLDCGPIPLRGPPMKKNYNTTTEKGSSPEVSLPAISQTSTERVPHETSARFWLRGKRARFSRDQDRSVLMDGLRSALNWGVRFAGRFFKQRPPTPSETNPAVNKSSKANSPRPNSVPVTSGNVVELAAGPKKVSQDSEIPAPKSVGGAADGDLHQMAKDVTPARNTTVRRSLENHPLRFVLPPEVFAVADHLQHTRGIDPELVIGRFLSAFGAAISPGVSVEVSESEKIPANLYFLFASPVGSGKSTVDSLFMKGIREFEKTCDVPYLPRGTERFIGADFSEAGFVNALDQNCHTSVYLVDDEAREFLTDLTTNSGRKLRPLVTKGFHREPYIRQRRHEIIRFNQLGLDICLAGQPDSVHRFAASTVVISSGVFARFLLVDCKPGTPSAGMSAASYEPRNEEIIAETLLALCELFRRRTLSDDGCYTIGLGADGRTLMESLCEKERKGQEQRPDAFFQRTIHQSVRVATVLTVADAMLTSKREEKEFVVPEVLDIKYLKAAYQYVVERAGDAARMQLKGSPDLLELISHLVDADGGLTLSDLKALGVSSTRVDTLLARHPDILERSRGEPGKQGGRPPWVIHLKPGVAEIFATVG